MRIRNKITVALLVGASLGIVMMASRRAPPAADETLSGVVVGVTDGDTIRVLDDADPPAEHRCRLWGIDAPEKSQAYGAVARERLLGVLIDDRVRCEIRGRDRYRRLLVWVRLEGREGNQSINEWLVGEGLAWHYLEYAPRADNLARAELDAREAGRGLWADDDQQAPWAFRAARRRSPTTPRKP